MNGLEPFISFDNFNQKVNIDKTHECVTGEELLATYKSKTTSQVYPYLFLVAGADFAFSYTPEGLRTHTDEHHKTNLFLRPLPVIPCVIDPATNKKVEDAIYVPVGKAVVLYGDGPHDTVVVRSRSNKGNLIVSIGDHNTGYELVKPPQPEKTFHGLTFDDFRAVVKELVGDDSVWNLSPSVKLGSNGFLTYIESDDNGEVASISVKDDGFIAVSSKLSLNWIGAYKLLTSKWVD